MHEVKKQRKVKICYAVNNLEEFGFPICNHLYCSREIQLENKVTSRALEIIILC